MLECVQNGPISFVSLMQAWALWHCRTKPHHHLYCLGKFLRTLCKQHTGPWDAIHPIANWQPYCKHAVPFSHASKLHDDLLNTLCMLMVRKQLNWAEALQFSNPLENCWVKQLLIWAFTDLFGFYLLLWWWLLMLTTYNHIIIIYTLHNHMAQYRPQDSRAWWKWAWASTTFRQAGH